MNPSDPLSFIPEKYRSLALFMLAVSPYATRAFYSLANGKGLKGIFAAIWLGTNTPKSTTPVEAYRPSPGRVPLLAALLLIGLSPLLAGCAGQSPERSTFTAATVAQSAVETAFAAWADDFTARARPFVVEDHPGHRAIDWTKCPGLAAEARTVERALAAWKSANHVAVDSWLTLRTTTGPTPDPAGVAALSADLSTAARKLIATLKTP